MRVRVAKLLVRLVVRLLHDESGHVVYLNTARQKYHGVTYAFLAARTPDHRTAISFPRDDDFKMDGYTAVPELVAKLAGWDVSRPYQDADAVPGA